MGIDFIKRFIKNIQQQKERKEVLVMTLLVRDEEDLLETNIEYHKSVGVDFFIITDNNSKDKTPEIIDKYVKLGIAKYIHEPEEGYFQSKWVTRMARMAYEEFNAEWVINNDADEFWWAPEHNLKVELHSIPKDVGSVVVNRRHEFIPAKGEVKKFYNFMEVRYKVTLNFKKSAPTPPKTIHRGASDVEISMGNHYATVKGLEKSINSDRLEIFHFPIITYAQFESKIIKSGDLSVYDKTKRWNTLFGLYKEGKLEAYYNEQLVSKEKIDQDMEQGHLVKDTRLKDYINLYLNKG
jgi:hypothetical protein